MKIVHFNSGLGNQIFQLMFVRYWENKGKCTFGYYNKKWLQQHNGLEVNRVLEGNMPRATILSNFVVGICRSLHRIDKSGRFFSSDINYNEKSVYYSGYWQDKDFYVNLPKPKFRKFELSEQNKSFMQLMHSCNSVSIHIRRGDYLLADTVVKMGNICTLDYYRKAIETVKETIDTPVFFVFSDDIEWAKQNIIEPNIHYIDWNSGKDSYLDMFLMAQCKAHIIANSSFSYWGAYLAEENIITIYPSKWYNDKPSPDIAPKTWIPL